MKRILCLLLALTTLIGITACRSDPAGPSETTGTTSSQASSTTTAPTPTDPTQPSTDVTAPSTEPSVDVTEPDEQPDDPDAPGSCDHQFEVIAAKESTCTVGGYTESTCTLCGLVESADLAPIGHSFQEATCTAPRTCTVCKATEGQPLGHSYTNGKCSRCGNKMPNYQDPTPGCSHTFQLSSQTAPTCTKKGSFTYTCGNCGDSYTESVPSTGHNYADATCDEPKTCTVCAATSGSTLGHSYGADHLCTRCGAEDPNKPAEPADFIVTVRDKKSKTISGITVTVYVDNASKPAGTATTGSNGKAVIRLIPGSSYKVVLSDVPSGYEAKESYTFRSLTTNITLSTIPIIDPMDHSKAQYKVGSIMGDFTLTDTDGVTYNLSQLLKTKNAVILNFWYVSCEPCKAEFPFFEKAYKTYGDDVQLLTMSHFDTEEQIRELKTQMGMTFPMIREDIGFREGFGLTMYPTTVVIGKTGKILMIHTGKYSEEEVMALFATYADQ